MHKHLKILLTVIGLAVSVGLSAKKIKEYTETPASDLRIEYTGRTLVEGNDVSYDWSGVYFRVRFNGPYLAMKCSDTKKCWFNLWTDKEMTPKADRTFMVGAKDTLVVLAEGLGKGEHEIILQKRTEGASLVCAGNTRQRTITPDLISPSEAKLGVPAISTITSIASDAFSK